MDFKFHFVELFYRFSNYCVFGALCEYFNKHLLLLNNFLVWHLSTQFCQHIQPHSLLATAIWFIDAYDFAFYYGRILLTLVSSFRFFLVLILYFQYTFLLTMSCHCLVSTFWISRRIWSRRYGSSDRTTITPAQEVLPWFCSAIILVSSQTFDRPVFGFWAYLHLAPLACVIFCGLLALFGFSFYLEFLLSSALLFLPATGIESYVCNLVTFLYFRTYELLFFFLLTSAWILRGISTYYLGLVDFFVVGRISTSNILFYFEYLITCWYCLTWIRISISRFVFLDLLRDCCLFLTSLCSFMALYRVGSFDF